MTKEFINDRITEILDLIEYTKSADGTALYEMEGDVVELKAMYKTMFGTDYDTDFPK